jgi:hypothetical protein
MRAYGLLQKAVFRIRIRIRIWIHRIHMFLGVPDPDPLVRGMDPSKSDKQKKVFLKLVFCWHLEDQ